MRGQSDQRGVRACLRFASGCSPADDMRTAAASIAASFSRTRRPAARSPAAPLPAPGCRTASHGALVADGAFDQFVPPEVPRDAEATRCRTSPTSWRRAPGGSSTSPCVPARVRRWPPIPRGARARREGHRRDGLRRHVRPRPGARSSSRTSSASAPATRWATSSAKGGTWSGVVLWRAPSTSTCATACWSAATGRSSAPEEPNF